MELGARLRSPQRPVSPGSVIAVLIGGPLGCVGALALARCGAVRIAPLPLSVTTALQMLVLAPVLEEIVFRGGLQELLASPRARLGTLRVGALSAANVVTSVAFAAFHLLHHPPLLALGVLAPSLVFGWLVERYRSLWPAIVVHAWYNFSFMVAFGR